MNIKKMMALDTPQWFAVKAAEKDTEAADRLDIFGVIGGSFFSDGTTAKGLIDECKTLKAKNIDVHICSPGGDVGEGLAIYSYLTGLKSQGKTVTIYVDGLAASIASVIAQAGDKRMMAESAAMHVHNAWTFAMGNATQLRANADDLDKITGQLVGVYQARSGQTAEKIADLLHGPDGSDGTLMTAAEALSLGFVDEIEPNKAAAACIGGDVWNNVPDNLVQGAAPAPAPAPEPSPAPAANTDEVEKLRAENTQLNTTLNRLAANALSPHKTTEAIALDWAGALALCKNDYVKARKQFPEAYSAYMAKAKGGKK